jgi:hypothetical protein
LLWRAFSCPAMSLASGALRAAVGGVAGINVAPAVAGHTRVVTVAAGQNRDAAWGMRQVNDRHQVTMENMDLSLADQLL